VVTEKASNTGRKGHLILREKITEVNLQLVQDTRIVKISFVFGTWKNQDSLTLSLYVKEVW